MKTKRVTMTGETVRDLYAAVHNPIIDLRLSRLRSEGTSPTKAVTDTELTRLELDILNKLEATLHMPLRASPPPNVRIESESEAMAKVEAVTPKKPVGRPKKKLERSDSS